MENMSREQVLDIYNNVYIKEHVGCPTIDKRYNCDSWKLFTKYHLPIRNHHEKNKKVFVDSGYFDTIDTEEKAYWLGFIMADGYVIIDNKKHIKRFGISITESDSNHLEKLKNAINSNVKIGHYEVKQSGYKIGTKYCRIIINDDNFVDNLIRHGCVPHKSNIIKPPTEIPKRLERHFIRGFMDGNGSITQNNTSYGYSYTIRFISTEEMLKWIMKNLLDNNIIEHEYPLKKRKEEHIVTSFEFGGNYLVKKFLDYIYRDATIWLERKHERYETLTKIIKEKEEKKNVIKTCCVCGATSNETNVIIYKKDTNNKYYNKHLCRRHYLQVMRHNDITIDKPQRLSYCSICGDSIGKLTLVGNKYKDYCGLTMCKRHYGQLYTYGMIKDNKKENINYYE